MKKYIVILCLFGMGIFEAPEAVASAPTSTMTTISASSEKTVFKKRRRNRQRKGFMWGLFRKKDKGCGCPSY
jgi:hypothetical protein